MIKFAGVSIAAIWFGGTVFFSFCAAPMFFSDTFKNYLMNSPHNGEAAQMLLVRCYWFHYTCSILALAHLGFDWVYTGKVMQRRNLAAVLGVFFIALFAGQWMHPKLERLYRTKYSEHYSPEYFKQQKINVTPELKQQAEHSFSVWHGISQTANLLILLVLWFYLWQMMHPKEGPRYLGGGKFNIDNHY
ncbi:MAG: DUF4149 domain-containing protein [Limisphaerales bacterium]